MLALLLLSASLRAECVESIHVDELSTRVSGLIEPIAFAEPRAAVELDALEALLEQGCVRGAVSRELLGALFMARGAYELLSQGDPALAERSLQYAAALTTPLESSYGAQVESAYRAATNKLQGEAIIELSFLKRPDVLLVDGEVLYAVDERRLPLGAHLVQWYSMVPGPGEGEALEEAWGATWVVLDEWGERVVVGGGPPLPDELPQRAAAKTPEPLTERVDRDEARAPREVTSRTDRPSRAEARLFVGYFVVDAPPLQSTDGMLTIDAWSLAPLMGGELELGQASRFVLSARHGLTPAQLDLPVNQRSAGPRLPTELRFLVATPSRDGLHVGLRAGLLVTSVPNVVYYETTLNIEGEPAVNIEVPRVDQALGAGPAVTARIGGGGETRWWLSSQGAWVLGAESSVRAFSGAISGGLSVPMGPLRGELGAELGVMRVKQTSPSPWMFPLVTAGVQWPR
jgi:hypothetical protein